MKPVLAAVLFTVLAGGAVFADDETGFTGEWIVESGDVSGSGITASIEEPVAIRQTVTASPQISGRGGTMQQKPDLSRRIDTYSFTVIPVGAIFDFVEDGSKLTGSVIRYQTEEPIFDGKINETRISFTVRETIKGKDYSYVYRGELSDGIIRFDVTPPSNGGKRFQFNVRRAKEP